MQKFNFNQFVTALREQLQLYEERTGEAVESTVPTLYQHYGRRPPPKYKRNDYSSRSSRKNPFDKTGKRMLCHTCGSDEHFEQFHKLHNVRRSVRDKLGKGAPTLNIVHKLVDAIEGLAPGEPSHVQDGPTDTNHLWEDPNAIVAQFYALDSGDTEKDKEEIEVAFLEELDQTVAVNHLSSSLSVSEGAQERITRLKADF